MSSVRQYLSGPAAMLRMAKALVLTYFRRPKSMRCMPAARNWSASHSCSTILAVPCMCMSLNRIPSMFSCKPDRMRGSSPKSCSVLSSRSCLDSACFALLCRTKMLSVLCVVVHTAMLCYVCAALCSALASPVLTGASLCILHSHWKKPVS